MSSSRGRLFIVLTLLLCSVFPSRVHAGSGIGVEGGAALPLVHGNGGVPIMLGVTFKSDKLPLIMEGRLQLNGSQVSGGGATADIWLNDIQIGCSIFNFYYGPGATVLYNNSVKTDDFEQSTGLFVAPRVFAGINTMLTSFTEMYMQVALEPGIVFDESEGFIFRINQPISIGIRFWF